MIMSESNGAFLFNKMAAIKPPETLSIFPLAPGWTFVTVCALLYMALRLYKAYVRYKENRYRRQALAFLKQNLAHTNDPEGLFRLIKHVSTIIDGATAPLQGQALLQWLDDYSPSPHALFNDAMGHQWQRSLFNPIYVLTEEQSQELYRRTEYWLRNHPTAKANS
ncbi:DUF4381 domain-containing protein [Vibrio sp. 10N.261.51.F12]|uniref:DUF4381 domain-containing protein n=1 Tax=Vibrio sp. 10N.261.51.F12 TaxID=3229679 RepID=UPI00354B10CD